MKILYGTTNHGKLLIMEKAMAKVGLEMIGPTDLGLPLPAITEAGKTPLENSEIKAKAYYAAFHMPVFSCDSGLYFEELPDDEQPGLFVRRVNGKELTDDEMIEYYASLAARHGGKLTGRYWNAVCFVYDESHVFPVWTAPCPQNLSCWSASLMISVLKAFRWIRFPKTWKQACIIMI